MNNLVQLTLERPYPAPAVWPPANLVERLRGAAFRFDDAGELTGKHSADTDEATGTCTYRQWDEEEGA